MENSARMAMLGGLLSQHFGGHHPSVMQSPFYQQSRPYQSINDAATASSRDGGLLALQRLFGGEMTPDQRIRSGFYDALPMEYWGR